MGNSSVGPSALPVGSPATPENPTLAMLADPEFVHLHMVRGTIAKPSIRQMLHAHGSKALEHWDRTERLEVALRYGFDLYGYDAPDGHWPIEMRHEFDRLSRAALGLPDRVAPEAHSDTPTTHGKADSEAQASQPTEPNGDTQ